MCNRKRPADGSGQILLYTSKDGFEWKFKSVLISNRNRFGKMWECPDLFKLDDAWVLLANPQGMLPKGFEYHNGDGTLCLIGDFDEEAGTFTEKVISPLIMVLIFMHHRLFWLPMGGEL